MVGKNEFVIMVAKRAGVNKNDTAAVLKAVETVYTELLQGEEDVKISDTLTLCTKEQPAKTCRNPRTGEPIEVPAKKKVVVKVGKALKDAVNI